VTFRDAAGVCGDLSLPETIGTSGPLYVYVGADCDGCDAIWYSVEICSGLTTAPPPGYAPTPAPATQRCFYMGSRFGDGDWTCPDGMRMPHEDEYNAVEECVPDDFVPSDYELGVAYSNTGIFDPTLCGCNWDQYWCGQPSIDTMWIGGSTGRACGDYSQLFICVG